MKRNMVPMVLVDFWMAMIFYLFHKSSSKTNGLSIGIIEIVEKMLRNIDLNIS